MQNPISWLKLQNFIHWDPLLTGAGGSYEMIEIIRKCWFCFQKLLCGKTRAQLRLHGPNKNMCFQKIRRPLGVSDNGHDFPSTHQFINPFTHQLIDSLQISPTALLPSTQRLINPQLTLCSSIALQLYSSIYSSIAIQLYSPMFP